MSSSPAKPFPHQRANRVHRCLYGTFRESKPQQSPLEVPPPELGHLGEHGNTLLANFIQSANGTTPHNVHMVVILSGNVQRTSPNQTALLERGAKRGVDVILVQEPRIHASLETINKAGYNLYGSGHSWNANTKTITVKNGLTARATPWDNPEGTLTPIFLPEVRLHIHSVYRYRNNNDSSWLHQTILTCKGERALWCGDFNRIGLQGRDHTQDSALLDFLMANYPILNSLDVPSRGNVLLDLACSRIPGALAYVDHESDVGSDHLPLRI